MSEPKVCEWCGQPWECYESGLSLHMCGDVPVADGTTLERVPVSDGVGERVELPGMESIEVFYDPQKHTANQVARIVRQRLEEAESKPEEGVEIERSEETYLGAGWFRFSAQSTVTRRYLMGLQVPHWWLVTEEDEARRQLREKMNALGEAIWALRKRGRDAEGR